MFSKVTNSSRRKELEAYHNSLLESVKNRWTYEELSHLLTNKNDTRKTYAIKDILKYIKELIVTDSLGFDCLMIDLEDLPLYINYKDKIVREIAEARLKLGK